MINELIFFLISIICVFAIIANLPLFGVCCSSSIRLSRLKLLVLYRVKGYLIATILYCENKLLYAIHFYPIFVRNSSTIEQRNDVSIQGRNS